MTIFLGLSQNIALLLSLTFIYGLLYPRLEQITPRLRSIIMGLLYGLFAVVSMSLPIQLLPGLLLDGRAIVVIIAALFGGPVSAGIAAVIVILFRITLGGIGVTGGLMGVLTATLIGILVWRYYQRRAVTRPSPKVLLLTGIIQALAGTFWTLLLTPAPVSVIQASLAATIVLYPLGLLLMGMLITYQQRSAEMEQKLQADQRRFRAIFDSAFQLIGLLQPDGTLLEANSAALSFGGVALAQVVGRPFWETGWWAVESQARLQAAIRQAAAGEFVRYEADLQGANGQLMSIDFSLKPVQDERGNVVMLVFEGRDISARKELEQQKLNLGLERERATLLKKFISDVSHDLRTPLAVMRLNLDLARRITDPQKQLQRIETVASQEQHLTRLLSDMMTMLSLDDGQSAFSFKPLDPYFIGQLVFDEHHSPAQTKKQTLVFNRALDPLTIRADQLELQRALTKLVANALTYTPDEGKITLSIFREADDALIEVCDTGIGISADDLPHIFQRFYRADQARSMHTGGAGLGLPIVQKIVEAHGGSVEVESTLGQGSVFRLRLPLLLDGTQPERFSLRNQFVNQLSENQRQNQLGNKR